MSLRAPSSDSFTSLSQLIEDMSKRLTSIPSFDLQKACVENLLETHTGGKAAIWVKKPPKDSKQKLDIGIAHHNQEAIKELLEEGNSPHRIITYQNQSHLSIPINYGSKELGKILLRFDAPPEKAIIEQLKTVGNLAGLAFTATLQKQQQEQQQKHLLLVRSVTAEISQITDLSVLTRQITKLIQQTFHYYYVAVFLINDETNRLHFKASAGSEDSQPPNFESDSHPGFALGEHMIGHVAKTGKEIIANDVTKEPHYKAVNALAATKSEVAIPLKLEDITFGVLDVQSDDLDAFDDHDLLVLRSLADNIAIAIQRTQLYETVFNRANQIATVSEVSRAITFILDIDELLNKIVSLINQRFHYPYVHLYLVDPVQRRIAYKAGSGARSHFYAKAEISFDLDADRGILPWVVENRQTKRVNNVKEEALYLDTPYTKQTTGSEMAIPLNFGGDVLGILDIQSDQINAFSKEDQQLMETLADNLAIAIRNAHLYRSEKWRRQVAESLRDVAGLLSDNRALEDVLEIILKELRKNLPCDIASIWLFNLDPPDETPLEEHELYLKFYLTDDKYSSEKLEQLSFFPDAWVSNALHHKHPTIRQPDETIGPIAQHYQMDQDYSAIAAPLSTGEEILGMLTLTHHAPNRYGLETQKITSAFASYAAIAIKNSRLYAISQEQAWISTILLQVAQATQSLTNLDELVATIVRLTPMVAGIKGCALFLKEPERDYFSLVALYGIGDSSEDLQLNQPIPLIDAPIFEQLGTTHQPVLVLNPAEDLKLPERFSQELSKDSLTLFPLASRNELLGAFLIADETAPTGNKVLNIINEERFNIIQGIIQQTAVAVENIRLIEGKQEEAYVSAVLLQAAQAVVSSANLQDTLDSIVNILPILVGIESSVIYLHENHENNFVTSHAVTKNSTEKEELLRMTFGLGEFPMLDTILKNNHPIVHPFIEIPLPPEDWDLALPDEDQIDPTPLLQSHFPILMGFPLSVKDEVFGVLLAQDNNIGTNRERRYELLSGIAQQASLAIQNDRLNKEMLDRQRLEREFQLAREIQQTFLPDEIPEMPGWHLDVRWHTARQVGGDFYDYFLLPDGRLAFVIADVSDKGLAASLYMTVTRTLLRASALESSDPAETLEHVNDLLLINSQDGFFVTTFYGILNLHTGKLTYTIAGHNPPLLMRYQTEEVIEFNKGGIALGALPDISLDKETIVLLPGDCLVLYTDGVTEAFNLQDQMYGDNRLKMVLKTNLGQNASSVLEALKLDLDIFRDNAPLSDDTTMLAICRSISFTNQDRNGRPA